MKLATPLCALALLPACTSVRPAAVKAATALTPATREYLLDPGSLAVLGTDVVSYFPEGGGEPLPGRAELSVDQGGVVYLFANAANRQRFLAAPERYMPAYGGWCAHAMADGGRKVIINPTNYLLTRGRLFLFYKTIWADALPNWNKDPERYEVDADRWWREISGEAPRKPQG
jgi:YHS domain-containing protein